MSSKKIAELNDAYRQTLGSGGRVMLTSGVNGNGPDFVLRAVRAVKEFSDFTPSNDPHGEHDFAMFKLDGETLYWKIDYYDADYIYGSEDPTDPAKTTRVLTIMLSSEY